MRYRRLGTTGLWLSEIALGSTAAAPLSRSGARAAFEAGVTTFFQGPSAPPEPLRNALQGLPRDEFVLGAALTWPSSPGVRARGLGRVEVLRAVRELTRQLGSEDIDLLVLPPFDHRVPLPEVLSSVARLVTTGVVHHLGVTDWSADQLVAGAAAAAEERIAVSAALTHYSMLWRVPEAQLFPAATRSGIGQLAYAPLTQGLLSGKYGEGRVPLGSRAADPGGAMLRHLLIPDLLDRIDRLGHIAKLVGLTPAQLATAWVLQNQGVTSAVVGTSAAVQVPELCAAAGAELGLDVLTQVDELLGSAVQTDPRLRVPTWL